MRIGAEKKENGAAMPQNARNFLMRGRNLANGPKGRAARQQVWVSSQEHIFLDDE
jgi:hypothetical protein